MNKNHLRPNRRNDTGAVYTNIITTNQNEMWNMRACYDCFEDKQLQERHFKEMFCLTLLTICQNDFSMQPCSVFPLWRKPLRFIVLLRRRKAQHLPFQRECHQSRVAASARIRTEGNDFPKRPHAGFPRKRIIDACNM